MDITKLNQYKEDGWLISQNHPTLPLIIWNYSQKTQYEQFWDEVTLICRGLVTDTDGNIISRGFPKFFNIEEEKHTPTNDFDVFEKLDGQYIGVFWYEGEMVVNSRGSFTSPYTIEAKRILNSGNNRAFEKWAKGDGESVYCFELIGFEQIVVAYPKVDLIMTGAFDYFEDEKEWIEVDLHSSVDAMMFVDTDIRLVKKFKQFDYTQIKQLNWKNSEGFVVRFSNGHRCKIKFEDYVNLHRQMTNLSTTSIWEALMNGEPVSSILNDVPDEFYDKVRWYEIELKQKYSEIEDSCRVRFGIEENSLRHVGLKDAREFEFRKKFAENISKYPNRSILFAMLDGKDYSKMIWKKLKPKFEKI